jgi:Skp family chaperone for outer membrane proteins
MFGTLKSAAIAAAVLAASLLPMTVSAQAQKAAPAVVLIVNMETVASNSAAGKQAQAELKAKFDALQARAGSLRTQFGSEGEALAKERPKETDAAAVAAWEAKVRDMQAREKTAVAELQKSDREFQESRNYVVKQITDAANPIITEIMRERGATIVMPEAATLQHVISTDITNEVIARLDKALPRVATTVPAAPRASP